jgi:SAM-dependent methyltransferase
VNQDRVNQDQVNQEQRKLWNGAAGSAWVEAQQLLDQMFQPFEDRLVEAVVASGARNVLDVGCGTGAIPLAVARRLNGAGRSAGIDISQPMIALARERAVQTGLDVEFIVGDAQAHEFAGPPFDMIISRFGVMFFADPVRAFSNLRAAASPGATLRCMVFRSPAENPFMTAAERAAAPLLPGLPARKPDAPGQFAFADARKVQDIRASSGWSGIEILPFDLGCQFPAAALDQYLMRLGPVGLALREANETTRARVIDAVRRAFAPYLHGDEVRFNAACWEIAARA